VVVLDIDGDDKDGLSERVEFLRPSSYGGIGSLEFFQEKGVEKANPPRDGLPGGREGGGKGGREEEMSE
jgi:hypothetical protein